MTSNMKLFLLYLAIVAGTPTILRIYFYYSQRAKAFAILAGAMPSLKKIGYSQKLTDYVYSYAEISFKRLIPFKGAESHLLKVPVNKLLAETFRYSDLYGNDKVYFHEKRQDVIVLDSKHASVLLKTTAGYSYLVFKILNLLLDDAELSYLEVVDFPNMSTRRGIGYAENEIVHRFWTNSSLDKNQSIRLSYLARKNKANNHIKGWKLSLRTERCELAFLEKFNKAVKKVPYLSFEFVDKSHENTDTILDLKNFKSNLDSNFRSIAGYLENAILLLKETQKKVDASKIKGSFTLNWFNCTDVLQYFMSDKTMDSKLKIENREKKEWEDCHDALTCCIINNKDIPLVVIWAYDTRKDERVTQYVFINSFEKLPCDWREELCTSSSKYILAFPYGFIAKIKQDSFGFEGGLSLLESIPCIDNLFHWELTCKTALNLAIDSTSY